MEPHFSVKWPPVTGTRTWLVIFAAATGIGIGQAIAVEPETVNAVGRAMPDATSMGAGQIPPVLAQVSLSSQTMTLYLDAKPTFTFTVSTGREGYDTPIGSWRAQWLSPHHRSRKYDNAPMPWSVFFYAGYAVHGTLDVGALGQPASHGCIRLATDEAKIFFDLVREYGMGNTLITVVN